jgi:hypothetical protein
VINRYVLGPDVNSNPTNMNLSQISDGSSNTIMAGERDSLHNIGAVWAARSSVTSASFEGRAGKGINVPYPNTPPTPTGTGDCKRLGFNSLHPGGVCFVFCDGSVHFLAQSTQADPNADFCTFPDSTPYKNFLLQNLIHPQDGYALNGNF